MKYLYIFLAIYLFFYLKQINNFFSELVDATKLLDKIKKLREDFPKFDKRNYDPAYGQHNEKISILIMNSLHADLPLINRLLPGKKRSFSVSDHPLTTIQTFDNIYSDLIYLYDELIFKRDRKEFLNPISPLKEVFLIPSKILSWFGLTLGFFSSRIFSGIIFLLGFIFENFGKDLINWFISLLK